MNNGGCDQPQYLLTPLSSWLVVYLCRIQFCLSLSLIHTVHYFLCFVVLSYLSIYPYSPMLLNKCRGNRMIATLPAMQTLNKKGEWINHPTELQHNALANLSLCHINVFVELQCFSVQFKSHLFRKLLTFHKKFTDLLQTIRTNRTDKKSATRAFWHYSSKRFHFSVDLIVDLSITFK